MGAQASQGTSIALWLVAGAVVMLGMARLPLVSDRLWRFSCWSVAVVLGLYAAVRIKLLPPGRIWISWAVLLILVLALAFWVERLLDRADDRAIEIDKESASEALAPVLAQSSPTPPDASSSNLIFDEAPPELAEMTPASLGALFASRTGAQAAKLLEQHIGKPVRVSGIVDRVELGQTRQTPHVVIKTSLAMIMFFDTTDNYDPEPIVLALNKGDRIAVAGQIYKIDEGYIALDQCKLLDARGGS